MESHTTSRTISAFIVLSLLLICGTVQAQDISFRERALRWGGSLGLNMNSASLGYQHLHEPFPNFDKPNTLNEKVNGTGKSRQTSIS